MGGGSQDTESKTVNKPPKWFNDAAIKSLEVADAINQAGYVPYMGNQVAAFTPMQQQAMQGVADWASAANGTGRVDAMAGMPQATVDGSGIAGYESATGMMRNLELMRERFPKQYDQLAKFGGDLIANPSRPPSDVSGSPWSVGDTAKKSWTAQNAPQVGGGGFTMGQLLSEGLKNGPGGAMMAFEGRPYFSRQGPGSQGMTSAYQRLADQRGLYPPRSKPVAAPTTQAPLPTYNNPAKWW